MSPALRRPRAPHAVLENKRGSGAGAEPPPKCLEPPPSHQGTPVPQCWVCCHHFIWTIWGERPHPGPLLWAEGCAGLTLGTRASSGSSCGGCKDPPSTPRSPRSPATTIPDLRGGSSKKAPGLSAVLSFSWCPHPGREKIEGRGGMGPPAAGSCHTHRGACLALGHDARPRAEERAGGGAGAGWKPNPAPGRAAPALPKPREPPAREGTRVTRGLGRGDRARRPLQGRGGGTHGVTAHRGHKVATPLLPLSPACRKG